MSALNTNQRRILLTYGAACALFFWLSHNFQSPNLIELPRLSFVLACLVGCCGAHLGASQISRWLPGANGRFDTHNLDHEVSTAKSSHWDIPQRPRRYFVPLLIGFIVLRLEVFIGSEHQCALPGLEACLPLIVLYRQLRLTQPQVAEDESHPDIARSLRSISIAGSIMICFGSWLNALPTSTSSYFCSQGVSRPWAIILQLIGIGSEAAIIEILWRVLSRQRTAKQLTTTVAGVLLQAAIGTLIAFVFQYSIGAFWPGTTNDYSIGSWITYGLEISLSGCLLALFALTSGSLITQSGPAFLVHILAIICGLVAVVIKTMAVGTWQGLSASSVFLGMLPLVIGAVLFIHTTSARAISPLVRSCLVLVLLCFFISTSIWAIVRRGHPTRMHPLQTMISEVRIETDRWLLYASTSDSLRVAVAEYRRRYDGREPPKGFDIWYAYAVEHKSPIIDFFDQIHRDLDPFWAFQPSQIRKSIGQLELEQDMVIITVADGKVAHSAARGEQIKEILGLVELMQSFSKHLPDLQFAVNLDRNPRVLAPWSKAGKRVLPGMRGRFSRRDEHPQGDRLVGEDGKNSLQPEAAVKASEDVSVASAKGPSSGPTIGPAEFRKLNMQACPGGSSMRSKAYWNTRDHCISCFNEESSGAFLKDWIRASDLCHQPDMLKLHGFFVSAPRMLPLTDLRPVFSRSKPSTFSDILIPWPRTPGNQDKTMDSGLDFQNKRDRLFWRGILEHSALSNQLYHGGHQERLVHIANNVSKSDQVMAILATDWKDEDGKNWFQYKPVSTFDMNQAMLPNVRIGEYTLCNTPEQVNTRSCRLMREEFGPAVEADVPLFDNRYILLTDSDTTGASNTGPGSDTILDALDSSSVPFVGTIFREWYSERLRPWLHFVPVDLRYNALHNTLAYFMGLNERGQINGRDAGVEGHLEDAVWIANQGRKWAGRAMRPADAQIYLFRLLLEWGRIVSEDRDRMNFVPDTA